MAGDAPVELSIIVPFHNRNRELNELLAGLPDDERVEVILVDDASSEEVRVERSFRHSNITRMATTADHRFAGSARNIGLAVAQGRYVCFCDSDDWVDPDALLGALNDALGSQPDVLYCRPNSKFEDGGPGTRTGTARYFIDEYCRTGNPLPLVRFHAPWSKLVRRRFIESNRLSFEATRVSNDVMFNAGLCSSRPVVAVSRHEFYTSRQGNASLTSDVDPEAILERVEVLHRYNDLLRKRGMHAYRIPVFRQVRALLNPSPSRRHGTGQKRGSRPHPFRHAVHGSELPAQEIRTRDRCAAAEFPRRASKSSRVSTCKRFRPAESRSDFLLEIPRRAP